MGFREDSKAGRGSTSRAWKCAYSTGRITKLIKIIKNNELINNWCGVVEIIYIFDQDTNANLDLFLSLVRDTSFPAPPGSGVRLIPCLLPRQEGLLTSDLTQKASILVAGLISKKILIALSVDGLKISDDNGHFKWLLLTQQCLKKKTAYSIIL